MDNYSSVPPRHQPPKARCRVNAGGATHYFYQTGRLAMCLGGPETHRVIWAMDIALVHYTNSQTQVESTLLKTDPPGSVLSMRGQLGTAAYAPYGHRNTVKGLPLLGFNGQYLDRITGGYPLGRGRRIYSTQLQRFQSPDTLSPFGKGGLNAYAYCGGDPINNTDPKGTMKSSNTNNNAAIKLREMSSFFTQEFATLANSTPSEARIEIVAFDKSTSTYISARGKFIGKNIGFKPDHLPQRVSPGNYYVHEEKQVLLRTLPSAPASTLENLLKAAGFQHGLTNKYDEHFPTNMIFTYDTGDIDQTSKHGFKIHKEASKNSLIQTNENIRNGAIK